LIECATYRHLGHFEGDPGTGYRSKEEIAEWKQRDPIERLVQGAIESGAVRESDFLGVEREVDAEVEQAYEFAKAGDEADPGTVAQFVYAPERP